MSRIYSRTLGVGMYDSPSPAGIGHFFLQIILKITLTKLAL